jgi:hypothetical protein
MSWSQEQLKYHYKQQTDQWTKGIKAIGRDELLKHFRKDYLTRQEAIKAFCYQCMGGYGDGETRNCANPPCPLYPYHPYNPFPSKMILSDSERKKRGERLSKVRSSRK